MDRALPDPLLTRFGDFVAARMGLHFPSARRREFEKAIGRVAKDLGFENSETCVEELLSRPSSKAEIEILASHLTVGETYFFRESKSFEVLEQHVLPDLIRARADTERRLRIWSAGCSTGEEPYSIAIALARLVPDLRDWNVTILATDINPQFLRKASLGIYGDWSFRGAPRPVKEEYFRMTREGRFEITPRVKSLVTVSYLNLAEDVYPSVETGTNAMDIIFCRNVLMYFKPGHARRILHKLSLTLMPDGWLFVSPADLPQATLPNLVAVRYPGAIVYRKGAMPVGTERMLAGGSFSLPSPADISAAALPNVPLENPGIAPRVMPSNREAPEVTPYERALDWYRQGRYAEVVEQMLEPLAQHASDARCMALLARSYANQGRLADALAWCEKANAADKLNPGWCYLLAAILHEQDRVEEAVAALKRALYLDQDYALAHYALGNLSRRQGRRKDAERHFRNALSVLGEHRQEQILPESEGVTAGRLTEIIRSTLSTGGQA